MRGYKTPPKEQDRRPADHSGLPVLADLHLQMQRFIGMRAQSQNIENRELQGAPPDAPLPSLGFGGHIGIADVGAA